MEASCFYNKDKCYDVFPASNSNQITHECFCLMGGLENPRLSKVQRQNGSYIYYTYHLTS
jgi:hypothetical protein